MRHFLSIFLLSFVAFALPAQTVPGITADQLNQWRSARAGDTLYVVNFWATWCEPCIEELPVFEKSQRRIVNARATAYEL